MNRILIVDDKEENLLLLRSLLEGYKFEVDSARNGADALRQAHDAPPDLVIADLLMPVMDGYTLLRNWKADEQLKTIPFVVYTATYTEPKDERLALDMGVDAFIMKPLEPETFVARLREVLDKAERGELSPPLAPKTEEKHLLKEYSEVLIRKLEEKALKLEAANKVLQEDVEERKHAEVYANLDAEVLRIMNEPAEFRELLRRVLHAVKLRTKCDAAGMRLRKGNDFPYIVAEGFSADFVLSENSLAACCQDGAPCIDEQGNVRFECACGLVVSGRTNPSSPLCTAGGSFWTNDSRSLLNLPLAEDPRFHRRNRCIQEGHLSLALVPVRTTHEIVGLLQLTSRKTGFFSPAAIRWIETIAAHIGEALMRVQAEEALRESEQRFRMFVEHAPDAIFVQTEGRFAYVNAEAVRLFGASGPDQLLGQPVIERFHPDSRALASERIRLINQERTAVPCIEERQLRLDGTAFDGEVSAVPISYGEQSGALVFVRDITERKRAEAEITRQQETIRELSTPVLAASQGLLIVPLIGSVDPQRARQVTEQVLRSVRANRAKVVVIDITGVTTMDTAVANHLIQTGQAARLLGAHVIVTGMSREIALTVVTLGVDLSDVQTMGELRSGIEEGHRLLGYELRPAGPGIGETTTKPQSPHGEANVPPARKAPGSAHGSEHGSGSATRKTK